MRTKSKTDQTESTRISVELTNKIRTRANENKRTFRAEHELLIEKGLTVKK